MEEEIKKDHIPEQEPQPEYKPRPKWQIWGARFLLAIFILLLIMYYSNLFRGGA